MNNKKTLVIVESPGKINKFKDILGPSYEVTTTAGIIVILDPKKLSVDIEDSKFNPTFIHSPDKLNIINKIKGLYSKSNGNIVIATDIDRVGESIGNDLLEILNIDKNTKNRLIFSSITKESILEGMKSLVSVNQKMVEAEIARKVIDRLVGYPVSQIVRKKISKLVSAGRVQSPVTKLIIEKETEIQSFYEKNKKSYFVVNIANNTLKNKNNKNLKLNEQSSINIIKQLYGGSFIVSKVESKKKLLKPFAPFTTSTFQQAANKSYGYSITKIMKHAQRLYEAGLITYHRTDSNIISTHGNSDLQKYISDKYGNSIYLKRTYSNASTSQGAHECIRPTNPNISQIKILGNITSAEAKLYSLIHTQTIMSQMINSTINVFTVTVKSQKNPDLFYTKEFRVELIPGFTIVKNKNKSEKQENIPKVGELINDNNIKAVETFINPPPRYSQGTLIKRLDPTDLNIGRPSTYSSTIDKIISRGFVTEFVAMKEKKESTILTFDGSNINKTTNIIEIGDSGKRLKPTFLGKKVTEFLNIHFSQIMDYKYTSSMEENLDLIKDGKKDYVNVVKQVYEYTSPIINILKKDKTPVNLVVRTIGKDPESNNTINIIYGCYGPYLTVENNPSKKSPIPKDLDIDTMTLDDALNLLQYPKLIGKHNGIDIYAKKGKFGIYIEYNKNAYPYNNTISTSERHNFNLQEIITIIENKKIYETDTKTYTVNNGQYGPYIKIIEFKTAKNGKKTKCGSKNISLPKDTDICTLKLDDIILLETNYVPKKKYTPYKKTYKYQKNK